MALCYHVTPRRLGKVPQDYAGCFGLLGEAGLIDRDLAEHLAGMARFRNLLVHMYWKVDYGRVYEGLEHGLEDLRAFAGVMARLV